MKLTEKSIFALFLGKEINKERFTALAKSSLDEYIIYNSRYLSDPHLRELFRVTYKLQEHWECSGVDFDLHISLDGDIITRAFLDKTRESGGGHGRPVVRALKVTQQELRVARRIMQYICN